MADDRPRVLAILPALFPSTIIGVAKPLLRLHQDKRLTLDLTLQYLVSRRAIAQADVVVMCHTIDPQYGWILDVARELGRPLVYEIDDDLLDIPADIPGLEYLREPARRALLQRCLRQADVVRVYSPALQQKLAAYNDRVELVSGPLDWSLMPDDPGARARDRSVVKLVYATSRLEDRIGQMVVAPLRDILARFPQVQLTIWGPRHDALAAHERVRSLPLIRDYDTFFERFAREGFDIGLAPLPDDEFHRGKSNNKFREYAACGIAGVYSDVSVYNTCVVDGDTGLLAANDAASWIGAIERLVTGQPLREGISARAQQYARSHFNERASDEQWLAQIAPLVVRGAPGGGADLPAAVSGGRLADRLGTVWALVRHGARLGGKAGPVLWSEGFGAAARRAWHHVIGLGQLISWEVHRRRLEQRVSAQRGRS